MEPEVTGATSAVILALIFTIVVKRELKQKSKLYIYQPLSTFQLSTMFVKFQ